MASASRYSRRNERRSIWERPLCPERSSCSSVHVVVVPELRPEAQQGFDHCFTITLSILWAHAAVFNMQYSVVRVFKHGSQLCFDMVVGHALFYMACLVVPVSRPKSMWDRLIDQKSFSSYWWLDLCYPIRTSEWCRWWVSKSTWKQRVVRT